MNILEEKWRRRFMALCEHIAEWSLDPSTKEGAVIVNYKKRVVGLGYNGFPEGVVDSKERYEDRAEKYPRFRTIAIQKHFVRRRRIIGKC